MHLIFQLSGSCQLAMSRGHVGADTLPLLFCSKKVAHQAARLRKREHRAAEAAAKKSHESAPAWRKAFPKRLTRDFRAAAEGEAGGWGDAEAGAAAAAAEAVVTPMYACTHYLLISLIARIAGPSK